MNIAVSIIIPALNEGFSIKPALEAIEIFGEAVETIVVDGGSTDDTVLIAQNYNVKILHSGRGRGTQMRAGAAAAGGDVFWFLHADTIAPPEAIEQIMNALKDASVVGGNFTVCFDGESGAAKFLTRLYPQLGKIGLIYGDSAIFARRDVYEKIGGFKPFPIFEDLDFINRLKRAGKIINLAAHVTTSSRRFENRSFPLVFLRWAILQVFYWLGVSPHTLVKSYLPHRRRKYEQN